MARKLTPTEFYELIGKETKMDANKVKEFWTIFVDVAVNELIDYGYFDMPLIGRFESKIYRSTHIPNGVDDNTCRIVTDTYKRINFRASDTFKDTVSGKRVTRRELMNYRRESDKYKKAQEECERQEKIKKEAQERIEELRRIKAIKKLQREQEKTKIE